MRFVDAFIFAMLLFTTILAGPNSNATLAIDLKAATQEIDSVLDNPTGSFTAAVLIDEAFNLDSYSFDIAFDTSALGFVAVAEDNSIEGLINILKKNGGDIISVNLGIKSGSADTIAINTTLTGSDSTLAPEGSGLLCIVQFSVKTPKASTISLYNVRILDYEGVVDSAIATSNARTSFISKCFNNQYFIPAKTNISNGVILRNTLSYHPGMQQGIDMLGRRISSKKDALRSSALYILNSMVK